MVFNLASAGLVWTDYLKNGTNVKITTTEFGLSITEIVFTVLYWAVLFSKIINSSRSTKQFISVSILIVESFNIAYSAYIIEYYNTQTVLPITVINMTLAIIIIDSITICGCMGTHSVNEKEDEKETVSKPQTNLTMV